MKTQFSKDFYAARTARGWSQDECADLIDVSKTSVANYENPDMPSFPRPKRWQVIRDRLGIDCSSYGYYQEKRAKKFGARSTGKIIANNGATVNSSCNYSGGATKSEKMHTVEVDDFELLLLMMYRKHGSRELGEACLKRMMNETR